MMNNNTPLLEMRNIKKEFFGNQVLTDINFTLDAGQVLGLAGENGAGSAGIRRGMPDLSEGRNPPPGNFPDRKPGTSADRRRRRPENAAD